METLDILLQTIVEQLEALVLVETIRQLQVEMFRLVNLHHQAEMLHQADLLLLTEVFHQTEAVQVEVFRQIEAQHQVEA